MFDQPFALKKPFISTSRYYSPGSQLEMQELCFYFLKEKLLVLREEDEKIQAALQPGLFAGDHIFSRSIGEYDATSISVIELSPAFTPPSAFSTVTLRQLFGKIDEDMFTLAGRAIQLIHWHKEHQFCGKCGKPMQSDLQDTLKKCPSCGFTSFPRISPAVIMAVTDRDRILLGRAPHFAKGVYSTLAGFVEPGETLEEAVRREVYEEVGLQVSNIRYMSSQPWPFPHSIMVGFMADYQSGEINIDQEELEDAQWFSVDNLPKIPSRITIARFLIDHFIHSQQK